jgi:hypothetical protein
VWNTRLHGTQTKTNCIKRTNSFYPLSFGTSVPYLQITSPDLSVTVSVTYVTLSHTYPGIVKAAPPHRSPQTHSKNVSKQRPEATHYTPIKGAYNTQQYPNMQHTTTKINNYSRGRSRQAPVYLVSRTYGHCHTSRTGPREARSQPLHVAERSATEFIEILYTSTTPLHSSHCITPHSYTPTGHRTGSPSA